jgi:DNA-binding XRE family transcriptional regulator
MSTIPFDRILAEEMADPEFRAEYERLAPAFAVAEAVIRVRKLARLTQAQLAERMGAKQPFVARIESGSTMPSVQTMMRIASATGTTFRPEFVSTAEGDHRACA